MTPLTVGRHPTEESDAGGFGIVVECLFRAIA